MKHFGDITKIDGHKVPIVDIITGGSPCQDLSIAGERKGLRHSELGDEETTRSGLFMEMIRIIKEMHDECRRTDKPIRPRWMVFENVCGMFSSNDGEDFRAVLEETARIADPSISIPRPPDGLGWSNVGVILADGWSLAWKVHSAEHWGFPKEERESRLSQILEDNPHPKYCLSPKACQGILNRAERRGKELPPILKEALEQSVSKSGRDVKGG